MPFTHAFARSFNRSGESLTATVSVTADAEDCRDIAVPAGNDLEVSLAVDVSALKSAYLISDQNLHINVNSGAGASIDLVANQPMQWIAADGGNGPFGASDVTKLLVDNAGEVEATLRIRILQDSTPA